MNIAERIEQIYQYRDNISEVIRSKGVEIPQKTKLSEIPQYIDELEYKEKPPQEDEWSEEFFEQVYQETLSDYIIERSRWNGHVDADGLREIGWTEDDIEYFQENGVDWNEEDDDLYLVSDYEKELYRTSAITTTNYIQSKINSNESYIVEWRNNVRWLPKYTNDVLPNSVVFRNFSKMIGCPKLNFSNHTNCDHLFSYCTELRCIPPVSFKANTQWSGGSMFYGCKKIKTIPDTIDWSYCKSIINCFRYCEGLMYVPELNLINVPSINYLFNNCSSLKAIKMSTSSVLKTCQNTFENCKKLITTSYFDTNAVTTMSTMFVFCESLVNIPNFNVSSCTNFSSTFKSCINLLNVPNMNFGNVTTYNSMFLNCYKLKKLPTTFNFTSTTDIANMCDFCFEITEFPYKLDLNTNATTASEGIKGFNYFLRGTKITEINFGKYFKGGGDSYIFNAVNSVKKIGVDDFMGSSYFMNGSELCYVNEINGELKGIRNSISFSPLITLDRENMLKVINALEDATIVSTTPKLTFGTDKLRNLTVEDKLIATNKGWVLA